jgi:hypothetical protein
MTRKEMHWDEPHQKISIPDFRDYFLSEGFFQGAD